VNTIRSLIFNLV